MIVRAERTPEVLADRARVRELLGQVPREVGAAVVAQWRFPPELVAVVVEHEDATRESPGLADYVDLVQVASLLTYRGTDHPWASLPWASVPATLAVGLEENEVESLLGYAGARVGELRRLLGPQSAASVAGSPVRRQAAG